MVGARSFFRKLCVSEPRGSPRIPTVEASAPTHAQGSRGDLQRVDVSDQTEDVERRKRRQGKFPGLQLTATERQTLREARGGRRRNEGSTIILARISKR